MSQVAFFIIFFSLQKKYLTARKISCAKKKIQAARK